MKKAILYAVLLSLALPTVLIASAHASTGYQIVAMPPISDRNVFYGGSVLDVKFRLLDPQGNIVTNAVATIWVDGEAGTGTGHLNTGNMFTINGQTYVFKLNTKPLSAGPGSPLHTITIMVTLGETMQSESFNVALH